MTVAPARGSLPYSHSAEGLYDPAFEHDACGVAFVATLSGVPSHEIIARGLHALRNLDHRGATGSDPKTGDGAGILMQIPDELLRSEVDFELPRTGAYAVGNAFLPTEPDAATKAKATIEQIAEEEHLAVLGWRVVPTDDRALSDLTRSNMRYFEQLFVTAKDAPLMGIALDRLAYCLRRRSQHEAGVYFPSLSGRTLVYKGMLTTEQLELVFPELLDERTASALAVVHSRFSTNTFPAWELAHPFRMIAHNGEINTVMGNRNWMRAREALLASDVIPGDLERLFPICTPDASDSASFDEVVELLHLGGRSLPHAMLMMIPEAWENNDSMPHPRRDFYAFHSCLMEPWDGPAGVVFTDGTQIGAVLDRNGLRPGRYWVTDDGLVVLASETGVLDIPAEKIVRKGRLQPGRMFLADLSQHRIISDDEIKASLAAAAPYGEWLLAGRMLLSDLPDREHVVHTHASVTRRQQVFGYTEEELRLILAPMASTGVEPLGSRATDSPIAALSDKPRLLFDYFSQLFAQVTNPPLDAIREELVTSLYNTIGPGHNLLKPGPSSCRRLVLPFPVLNNDDLTKIVKINRDGDLPGYATYVARGLYEVSGGADALRAKLDQICAEVSKAIEGGARIILLSDRHSNGELAPIPSLLLTAAVHHHLVREKSRTQVGLVVEAGDVREVHHVALLIGYGAAAVNPYLAIESVEDLARRGVYTSVEPEKAVTNVVKALGKGVLKVMSKMGVSTVASYTGAQIFEALGLARDVVDRYFTGTTSKLGGVGLTELAEEVHRRHLTAYPADGIPLAHRLLPVGGEYQWRREGEPHLFDPETVFRLQHSTRSGRYDIFQQYTNHIDSQSERLMTLRGLLKFDSDRDPIPIDQVEPVSEIVKRFSTGAMSYGSISAEAHQTLAIAMNRIGGKSNTEGGAGTVAAGVSKAKADVVLISGHDGGTGAAPLTSLKHAGGPWELGLAETQQTLLINGLRDRIVVQVDGQLKTGRDVIIGALLGAEEFGFATAPLVVSGCIMMRVCHLDTCPVGVATQNEELRKKFSGKPEFVVNFFEFIAEEVREYLAELGFRSLEEAIGHVEVLDTTGAEAHWKAHGLDLRPVLHKPDLPDGAPLHNVANQDHALEFALDQMLIKMCEETLKNGEPVRASIKIRNVNRTVGTILGHEVTKATKGEGFPDGTIDITFIGSAGQSFGAFIPAGMTLRLEGDRKDYFAKGLSGGRIVVRPDRNATFVAEDNIIAGNVIGYGATSGEIFIRGQVGERFCVRNSGATAVVEGLGDHGCEYMTGGIAVVLGRTGRNVAAGMSGGLGYFLDLDLDRLNTEMVDALAPSDADLELLKNLVTRHHEETESAVAKALLADWTANSRRFTKVLPRDYARVLAARTQAETEALTEAPTTSGMMEPAHGC